LCVFEREARISCGWSSAGAAVAGSAWGYQQLSQRLTSRAPPVPPSSSSSSSSNVHSHTQAQHKWGVLSFAPHEAIKTISIPIFDDKSVEQDEDFYVTLKDPSDQVFDNGFIFCLGPFVDSEFLRASCGRASFVRR